MCFPKHIIAVRAPDRDAKTLMESRKIYFMCLFCTHTYMLNCFVIIMYSDLGNFEKILGTSMYRCER